MKKFLVAGIAAAFCLSLAAGAAEVTRTDEVRVNPDVQRNVDTAKNKTKRVAKKAKKKTKKAARRTRDAAAAGVANTRQASQRAADRVDAERDRPREQVVR